MISAEAIAVENYRLSRFLSLGFSVAEAEEAEEAGYDWHEVSNLISAGCEKQTALRILAPIERSASCV